MGWVASNYTWLGCSISSSNHNTARLSRGILQEPVMYLVFSYLLIAVLSGAALSTCEQDAQTVASGRGGPSLTPQQAAADSSLYQEFSANTYTACTVQEDLYRSYRGALSSSDKTVPPVGACKLGPDCSFTKVNSLQVSSCSELLRIRDALVKTGGYTALCRHELTDWSMKPQEDFFCKPSGQCTASLENKLAQRQLSPAGLRRAQVVGESLKSAGVEIDTLSSSPFERCKMTAQQVGLAYGGMKPTVRRGVLSSTSDYRDYERAFSYSSTEGAGGADVKKIVATRCRQWLQEDQYKGRTARGNRMAYAHSSTVGSAIGISLDEGDCAWVRPTGSVYSNIQEDVQLSNHTFEKVMDTDAKRVGLLAVLSPEQTQKMGQCSLLREELAQKHPVPNTDYSLLAADINNDLKITEEEFTAFCSTRNCAGRSADLWKIILTLNARPFWKSQEERKYFYIGEHVYFNGGWRELVFSAGGWMFPWHRTTLDTIRQSSYQTKQLLGPIDYLIEHVEEMGVPEVEAVAGCTPTKALMGSCAETLLAYKPIPTSSSADPVPTKTAPAEGATYPYPGSVDIPDTPNPLFNLARCLVERGHVTGNDMREMLGCQKEECGVDSGASTARLMTAIVVTVLFLVF